MIVTGSLLALPKGGENWAMNFKYDEREFASRENFGFDNISFYERPMFTHPDIIISPTLSFLVDNQVLFTSPIARLLSSQIIILIFVYYARL